MIRKIIYMLVISICFFACSSDSSSNPEDKITSVTMKINGVPMTFEPMGYGIDLTSDGYKLSLWFSRYVAEPYENEDIYLEMKYKKTGTNVIRQFHYSQNINGENFGGDFVDGTFENKVSVNSNSRFKATATGSLTIGDKTVTITDLKMNYVYDEPFD